MGWQKFDFLEAEKAMFAAEIREVILPLYEAGVAKILELKKQTHMRFEKATMEAKSEAEQTDALGQAAYEDTRYDEQNQAIGSLALHHLCIALRVALADATRFFKKSHPRLVTRYPGKNWFARLQDEYKARFGIDFEKAPTPIAKIEELALARNAGLHWDGDAVKEYKQRVPKPRFLDFGCIVRVRPGDFTEAVAEAETFLGWVIDQLKELRTQSPSANQE
jgi:hypothetical protein